MNIFDVLLTGLANSVRKVADGQTIFVQTMISTRAKGLSVLQETTFGISWGYAEMISVYVAIIVLLLALFRRSYFSSFGQASLIVVTISTLGFAWFTIGTALQSIESYLLDRADFYTPPEGSSEALFSIPGFDSPLWDIVTIFMLSLSISPMALLYGAFDTLRIAMVIVLPISVALIPLGPRSKKFFQIALATTLLTMVFGRPAGKLAIELGQWASHELNITNSPWMTMTFTLLSIALVYVFVIITAIICYKTPDIVNSLVKGSTEVSGDITAKLAPGQTIDSNTVRMEMNNAMPMPVTVIESETSSPSMTTKGRDLAIDSAALAAVTVATIKGGETAGRVTKVVTDSAKNTLKSTPN